MLKENGRELHVPIDILGSEHEENLFRFWKRVNQADPQQADPQQAEQPANNVNMAQLNTILENCSIPDDDEAIRNRLRALVCKGNNLSDQFIEQDIQDLLLVYTGDRLSFDKLFPLLNLDKNPTTNVMRKIRYRADPLEKAKHALSARKSYKKKQDELRAARAQQNM
jgi:hypothetical protein